MQFFFGKISTAILIFAALFSSCAYALETKKIEKRVFELVNTERAKRGLKAYGCSRELESLARLHSQNMVKYSFFSHTDYEGKDARDRKLKYFPGLFSSNIAENIAYNVGKTEEETAQKLMRAWMISPTHRANILSSEYTYLGVGVVEHGEHAYATQNFGDLIAVLKGPALRRIPFGSEITLKFCFLGGFAKNRLTVFVHFPDKTAKVHVPGGKYYAGLGPYEPLWEGNHFTIKILCNKGRGIYNVTMGIDGEFDPEGLRFEVR